MRLHERVTKIEAVLPTLATKEDLAREVGTLRSEMHQGFAKVNLEFGKVRQEMSGEFAKVRQEMSGEFAKVRQEISGEFAKVRQEIGGEVSTLRGEIGSVKEEVRELRQTVFSEINGLRIEMHQSMGALMWRLIGTLITVCTALVAATHFISRSG
ncbi:coiled-coil domain-containing protein [Pandoraea sp. PE-S2T-3]|uniref:coiled-coil domain-containing protein n=1 Tax=Pandoraea sp. PE-S2T-3 TaxID=1986993 RepID=UPI001595C323|nr:coiled-coil domain-containing protein [Pandoraea sp. PE-S2T-3]